ncbi:ion transporter [Oculatella sp. LEGE 06141]|nr:ion transporter [Oculatella sp. LEGE 06141]
MTLRKTLSFYLEDLETPIGKAINLVITGLVLLSSAIFVTETYSIPASLRITLNQIDTSILVLFSIEYLLRFWSAEQKIKYFFSLYSLIDLLAILPFLLGATDIRFIRIFRWFRILRLIRYIEGKTIFGYVSSEDSAIFTRILFTLFTIIFVYSGLIYQVEHPANSTKFGTFLDAVYFSVATMTTVGFGDITPISEIGRFLTVLMILTGIALIPWQIGNLIRRVVKTTSQVELLCPNCRLALHDADARFCKVCGTALPQLRAFCDVPLQSLMAQADTEQRQN